MHQYSNTDKAWVERNSDNRFEEGIVRENRIQTNPVKGFFVYLCCAEPRLLWVPKTSYHAASGSRYFSSPCPGGGGDSIGEAPARHARGRRAAGQRFLKP